MFLTATSSGAALQKASPGQSDQDKGCRFFYLQPAVWQCSSLHTVFGSKWYAEKTFARASHFIPSPEGL